MIHGVSASIQPKLNDNSLYIYYVPRLTLGILEGRQKITIMIITTCIILCNL